LRALSRTARTAGISSATAMPMIAITTSSSINVNAERLKTFRMLIDGFNRHLFEYGSVNDSTEKNIALISDLNDCRRNAKKSINRGLLRKRRLIDWN
jgi:hypothetical protein